MYDSEFGNYLAGYTGYYNYGTLGDTTVRRFGDMYELGLSGHLDDPGSKYFISAGILRAQTELGGPKGVFGRLDFIHAKGNLTYGYELMVDAFMDNNDDEFGRQLKLLRS